LLANYAHLPDVRLPAVSAENGFRVKCRTTAFTVVAVMQSQANPNPPEGGSASESISWARIKTLFEAALALHGEERERFLRKVSEESVTLREELETLLQHHDETGEFLAVPIASVSSLLDDELLSPAEPREQIGARIGAYRIEKEIGRGGM